MSWCSWLGPEGRSRVLGGKCRPELWEEFDHLNELPACKYNVPLLISPGWGGGPLWRRFPQTLQPPWYDWNWEGGSTLRRHCLADCAWRYCRCCLWWVSVEMPLSLLPQTRLSRSTVVAGWSALLDDAVGILRRESIGGSSLSRSALAPVQKMLVAGMSTCTHWPNTVRAAPRLLALARLIHVPQTHQLWYGSALRCPW